MCCLSKNDTIYGMPHEPLELRVSRWAQWIAPSVILVAAAILWGMWGKLSNESWGFAAPTAAVSLAVFVWNLARSKENMWRERITTSMRYIERFNDPAMVKVKVEADSFWREYLRYNARIRDVESYLSAGILPPTPQPTVSTPGVPAQGAATGGAQVAESIFYVYAYLNFLEELAMAYRRNYVDRRVVHQWFEAVLNEAAGSYRAFIDVYRSLHPGSFPHLLILVDELSRENANKG